MHRLGTRSCPAPTTTAREAPRALPSAEAVAGRQAAAEQARLVLPVARRRRAERGRGGCPLWRRLRPDWRGRHSRSTGAPQVPGRAVRAAHLRAEAVRGRGVAAMTGSAHAGSGGERRDNLDLVHRVRLLLVPPVSQPMVHQPRPCVRRPQVRIDLLQVPAHHLQAGMAEKPLQRHEIAPVPQRVDRERAPKGV